MTVLVKPSLIIKKTPLIYDKCDEAAVDIHPDDAYIATRPSPGSMLCTVMTIMSVILIGLVCGFMLYHQYVHGLPAHRYKGFCTIPIYNRDPSFLGPQFRVFPRFEPEGEDIQVVSTLDEAAVEDTLREEIQIDDSVEKIIVDRGHPVSFIHDFESNNTGIIDAQRCFTMELDPELVLSPEVFALGIARGGRFEVSRVRTALRAALPALHNLSRLPDVFLEACHLKPTYRLDRDDVLLIQKRSVDEVPLDYMQFSGKHVQEIVITNLAALDDYERNEH